MHEHTGVNIWSTPVLKVANWPYLYNVRVHVLWLNVQFVKLEAIGVF